MFDRSLDLQDALKTYVDDLRFLLHDDNYFASMRNMWSDFRTDIGRMSSFELCPLPELYEKVSRAMSDPASTYDVVAVNMPWLGRLADGGRLAPLDDVLSDAPINPLDFHPTVWNTGRWQGRQYGIPIYCTAEIMTARKLCDVTISARSSESLPIARRTDSPSRRS